MEEAGGGKGRPPGPARRRPIQHGPGGPASPPGGRPGLQIERWAGGGPGGWPGPPTGETGARALGRDPAAGRGGGPAPTGSAVRRPGPCPAPRRASPPGPAAPGRPPRAAGGDPALQSRLAPRTSRPWPRPRRGATRPTRLPEQPRHPPRHRVPAWGRPGPRGPRRPHPRPRRPENFLRRAAAAGEGGRPAREGGVARPSAISVPSTPRLMSHGCDHGESVSRTNRPTAGLRSVARNNKATRLLTRPGRTS